jgi:mitogen-activated protein kinase 1/3
MMFDPNKRCTINEALAHPYLANFHNPEDEPEALKVDPLDFEFEQHNLTLQ